MSLKVKIFDFDQTITKSHTFHRFGLLDTPSDLKKKESYKSGQLFGKKNLKEDINQHLLHDDHFISAVATHHNNSAFVAGCISASLMKELYFEKTVLSDTNPETAIDYYRVAGQSKPFLISYIPKYGEEFTTTLKKLHGKNEQLLHLHDVMLVEDMLDWEERVSFYDDTRENFEQAATLGFINRYLVEKNNPKFQIESSKVESDLKSDVESKTNSKFSASLFCKIMCSTQCKLIAVVLLLAGLASLGVVALGINIPVASACAVIGLGLWAFRQKGRDKNTTSLFQFNKPI